MVSRFLSFPLAVLSVAGALPTALHAQPVAPASAPVRPRTAQGIYTEFCANCHGQRLEGNRAPSMLDDIWAHGGDDDSLARSIRDGWIKNEMPPFKAALSEPEIRAMVVYIREVRGRAAQGGRSFRPPQFVNPDGRVVKSELATFKIERVAADLQTPWGIAFLPDGRLIVSERPGRIRIIEPGKGIVETITGVPPVWSQQDGGLFDIALHPDYAHTGWLYLAFSEAGPQRGTSATRIIRARIRDSKLVDVENLFQPTPEQYWESNIHYGARFLFDRAGFLYYSIGERGHREEAQSLTSPYGKLHRVHDDGSAPDDNPFVKTPGALKTIWSYGHRNQQGIAQHPVTGELWASEHGPRGGDELNLILPGHNYGWPVITYGMNDDGTPITDLTAKEGMDQPVTYWTPSIATAAIEFYTGDKFPQWKNQLFLAALAGQQLRRLELEGHQVVKQEIIFNDLGRVREVATGPDGYLYVALNTAFADSPGQIIRLVPSVATSTSTISPVTAPLTAPESPKR